ncbi:MAG: histidine kinase [Ferruginibacter sp.]
MRKVIVFILFMFAVLRGISQAKKTIDSLKNLLTEYTEPDSGRVKVLLEITRLNLFTGSESELIPQMNEALEISKKISWVKGEALVYIRLGAFYNTVKGEYVEALGYYLKGLKANETFKNKTYEKDIIGNIGLLYHDSKQYEKALEYLNRAKQIGGEISAEEKSMFNINLALANTFVNLKKIDSALVIYNHLLKFTTENNLELEQGMTYGAAGYFLITLNKFDTAKIYLEKAILIGNHLAYPFLEATALRNISLLYNQTGKKIAALAAAKKALKIFQEIQSPGWESMCWEAIAVIYQDIGEYKKAWDAHVNFIQLKDSTASAAKQQETGILQAQFEFEKKEAVLNATHQSEVKQEHIIRNGIIIGSGILIFVGLISFIFYKRKRDAVAKKNEAEFKTEVADTEMKALRAQMNPHFIFNSLNSISDYIAKNDTQSADRYLGKFAKLMRMILENSEQKEVPLAEDLKALELYMQLEALRMNNKFSYEIIVDDLVDREETMVPPLILQPFVENSIWHGIARKEGQGKILIYIKKEGEDMINCIVEDDGIGRQHWADIKTTLSKQEKTSLGMKITQSRIDILNKIKNTKAAVQLFDLAHGLRVEVRLPLANNL